MERPRTCDIPSSRWRFLRKLSDNHGTIAHYVHEIHPYPLIFMTGGGSHLYQCASSSSDYDIYGCHLLPLDHLLGLNPHAQETIEQKSDGNEHLPKLESVTHDLRKFVFLLLKSNGNVLESLYSPMVFLSSHGHEELKELAKGCITKKSAAHYKGMAFHQQQLLANNPLKKILHMYRCLLMGIFLMQTGRLEMRLPSLAERFHYQDISDLIVRKRNPDALPLSEESIRRHLVSIESLVHTLDWETEQSHLPEAPSKQTRQALEKFIIVQRKEGEDALSRQFMTETNGDV